MYSDLKGHMINNSVIPQGILVTAGFGSKPDLVIISRQIKKIVLLELTSPLERNLNKAHDYKVDKYTGIESDLKAKGWTVHLVPLEVGSRGHILKHTKNHITSTLKELNFKIKHHNKLFQNMSKISVLCTFSIFHAYQTKEWVNPPLLKP